MKHPEPKVAWPSAGAWVQLELVVALLELLLLVLLVLLILLLPPPHPLRANINARNIIRFIFFILPTPLVKPSSNHYR